MCVFPARGLRVAARRAVGHIGWTAGKRDSGLAGSPWWGACTLRERERARPVVLGSGSRWMAHTHKFLPLADKTAQPGSSSSYGARSGKCSTFLFSPPRWMIADPGCNIQCDRALGTFTWPKPIHVHLSLPYAVAVFYFYPPPSSFHFPFAFLIGPAHWYIKPRQWLLQSSNRPATDTVISFNSSSQIKIYSQNPILPSKMAAKFSVRKILPTVQNKQLTDEFFQVCTIDFNSFCSDIGSPGRLHVCSGLHGRRKEGWKQL